MQYPGLSFPASAGTNRLISEGAQIIPDETSLGIAISLDFDCLVQEQLIARLSKHHFYLHLLLLLQDQRACMEAIRKRTYRVKFSY